MPLWIIQGVSAHTVKTRAKSLKLAHSCSIQTAEKTTGGYKSDIKVIHNCEEATVRMLMSEYKL